MGNIPSQPGPNPTEVSKTVLPSSTIVNAALPSDTTMGSLTSATSTSYSKTTTVTVPGTLIVDTTSVVTVLASAELPSSTTGPSSVKPLFLFDGRPLASSTKKELVMESDSASTSTSSTDDDVPSKGQSSDSTTMSTSTTPSTSTTTTTIVATSTKPTTFMPTTHEPPSSTDSSSFTFRRCVHSDSPEEGTSDGCILVVAPLTSGGGDGVSTLPLTTVLTSLSLPTFDTTMNSMAVASASSAIASAGGEAVAPLSASSTTEKHSPWSAAKVLAPTVVISVLIAALVLWWLIRRERKKNIERERQIEEKAQFFSQSWCDGLRERMMAGDEGKTAVLGVREGGEEGSGRRDLRESGWVGGSGSDSPSARDRARDEMMEKRMEQGKESLGSVSVIERDIASARGEKAGGETESPVSSQTPSPNASRDGNAPGENASSNGSLTALPTENWKVFRGSREIQPYQPSQRKEGEWELESVLGRVRRSLMK